MGRSAFLAAALGAIAVIFIAVNAIAGVVFRGAQLDLTADHLYTLSRGSREVIDDLAEPIDLQLFYSRGLAQDFPEIRAYGARVRETLQAMAARSNGKLRLEIINPDPFSEEEDQAIAAGVRGVPIGDGSALYFGLVARNALDETAAIGFFNPDREPYLEYELLRLISDLKLSVEPKVALISSLPLETQTPNPFRGPATTQPLYVYDQLLSAFDVDTLDRDFAEIPADADVLVIAHPWELDEGQLWAVDQFMLTRGRAVIVVDPYSRLALAPGPTGYPDLDAVRASTLGPLLPTWGVLFDSREVVLDRANALLASVREDERLIEREFPAWFEVPPGQLSADHLATAALTRGVRMAAAGHLDPIEGASTSFEPLIVTSEDARRMDVDGVVAASPRDLLEGYAPEGAFTLAARISGEVESAFPDGPPEGIDRSPADVQSGQIEAIVIADSDLLDDEFYVSPDPVFGSTALADNAAFVLNAVDLLSGSDALIGLRSRGRVERPMSLIEDMRATAAQALAAEQSELEAELEAAEQRLVQLESEAGGGLRSLNTDAERDIADETTSELLRVRDTVISARARLREIERSYRADIDRIEALIIAINVWLVPMLVALVGVGVFVSRRRGGRGRRAAR
ncbi:MAG: Gldg family protein [Maricaulaceae bacterium]|jgi:ABC-type uncharacterized transport system involved in gliding motility auxiliary subunit